MGRIIEPGAVLGVIGGGERARLFALAAERMGYRVHALVGRQAAPASTAAEAEVRSPFEDEAVAVQFAGGCDAVAVLTEHVPPATLRAIARVAPVFPSPEIIEITQNRLTERGFLDSHSLPAVPYCPASSIEEIEDALHELGAPALAKCAMRMPGEADQHRIDRVRQADEAWAKLGERPGVVETLVREKREITVIVARAEDGVIADFAPFECTWRNRVLDLAEPASLEAGIEGKIRSMARTVANKLGLAGVLSVEFFLTPDDQILIHKLIPHPDNAGYLTNEGCASGQFEQLARVMCGMPLGSPRTLKPAVMANLMGDAWSGGDPDLSAVLAYPGVKLTMYGKTEARPGRKMGHLVAVGESVEAARSRVLNARNALTQQQWPEFLPGEKTPAPRG